MHFNWTGTWPVNRAPLVFDMLINDVPAQQNIILSPGESMVSRVAAGDPENDSLSFIWELPAEPTVPGIGGSRESRPNTLTVVKPSNLPKLNLRAPLTAGDYRLFVYVLDNNGHVGQYPLSGSVVPRIGGPQLSAITGPGLKSREKNE